MSGSPLELRRSASYQSSHGKLSVESSTSTRPSSTVSGGSSYYRGLQLEAEIEAGNQPSPVLRSYHIMHIKYSFTKNNYIHCSGLPLGAVMTLPAKQILWI